MTRHGCRINRIGQVGWVTLRERERERGETVEGGERTADGWTGRQTTTEMGHERERERAVIFCKPLYLSHRRRERERGETKDYILTVPVSDNISLNSVPFSTEEKALKLHPKLFHFTCVQV